MTKPEGADAKRAGGALVLDGQGRVVAATAELLAASGRPLMEVLGANPSEIWPGLGASLISTGLARAPHESMDLLGLGVPNWEQLFLATIPEGRETREGPRDSPARAAWRAVDACLARVAHASREAPFTRASSRHIERLRSLVPLLLAMAREVASTEIRRWARSADARVLLEGALHAAQPRLPQLIRIQRNYQPARLMGVDTMMVEEALADVLIVAGAALEAGARASAVFCPALELTTDTDGEIRLLISHNAPGQSRAILRALFVDLEANSEGPPAPTLGRAQRLVRAFGGDLDADERPSGGATFGVRFPAGGRG
jgi:signal transduction histidine kinase